MLLLQKFYLEILIFLNFRIFFTIRKNIVRKLYVYYNFIKSFTNSSITLLVIKLNNSIFVIIEIFESESIKFDKKLIPFCLNK